ncbi:hypothetical protein MMC24_001466 [Lignoscripta atroalba]|nr:hypothetical protein [Lignoscripta atroalba]
MRRKKDPSPERRDRFYLFLRLPTEVRINIYKYVVIADHPIAIRPRQPKDCGSSITRSGRPMRPGVDEIERNTREISHLAVAFTCRQIYAEAAPIYYAKNQFTFFRAPDVGNFAETIGHGNQQLISVIDMRARVFGRKPLTFSQLPFPALKHLHVEANDHHFRCTRWTKSDFMTSLTKYLRETQIIEEVHLRSCCDIRSRTAPCSFEKFLEDWNSLLQTAGVPTNIPMRTIRCERHGRVRTFASSGIV